MPESTDELANKLIKQGLAKTWLDARRMAESMSSAKPFDSELAKSAEKFWIKGQANPTNLNMTQSVNRFSPAQAPAHHPTPVQQFTTSASASEVTELKREIAMHKDMIMHLRTEINQIKAKLNIAVEDAVQKTEAVPDVDVNKMFYSGKQ
jgi:hypothetical protein